MSDHRQLHKTGIEVDAVPLFMTFPIGRYGNFNSAKDMINTGRSAYDSFAIMMPLESLNCESMPCLQPQLRSNSSAVKCPELSVTAGIARFVSADSGLFCGFPISRLVR